MPNGREAGSSLFVGASPLDCAHDGVLSRLRTLGVLDKCRDHATGINLTEVEHLGGYNRTRLVLDGLHPPSRAVDCGNDQLFPFPLYELCRIGHVLFVTGGTEQHHVTNLVAELHVARAEHDTIANGPGGLSDDLHGINTVIRANFLDVIDCVVCCSSKRVPILKESAEIVWDQTLNSHIFSEAYHDVGSVVPGLANFQVPIVLLDLHLMVVPLIEDIHELLLGSGANLITCLCRVCCFNHLLFRKLIILKLKSPTNHI